MAYPQTLDAFENPTPSTALDALSHAGQHSAANDAIEALQLKVGIDASADPNSLDYKLANLPQAWPVGSVFVSVVATDPATLLGYGTWAAIGAGRTLIGLDAGDSDFDAAEKIGGAKTVTLTGAQSGVAAHGHGVTDPGHSHLTQRYPTATGGSSGFTIDTSMSGTLVNNTLPTASATTGLTVNNASAANAAEAHQNMPPFFVVYFWKRTA